MNYLDKILDHLDKDALFSRLGLETKPSPVERVLSAVGFIGAGALLGAGLALLLAPKSGREFRQDLRGKMHGANHHHDEPPAPLDDFHTDLQQPTV